MTDYDFTIVSPPCFELSDDDFESDSNEFELAFFDAELYSIVDTPQNQPKTKSIRTRIKNKMKNKENFTFDIDD